MRGLAGKEKEKLNEVRFHYKLYDTSPDKLTDLLSSLKRIGFVGDETDLRIFKKCFGGLSAIEKKIRWTGTMSALHYFIIQLHETGVVSEETNSSKGLTVNPFVCSAYSK